MKFTYRNYHNNLQVKITPFLDQMFARHHLSG